MNILRIAFDLRVLTARLALCLVLILPMILTMGCASRQAETPVEPGPLTPNLTVRAINVVRGSPDRLDRVGIPDTRRLRMNLTVVPEVPSLSKHRTLQVSLTLANEDKSRAVNLAFPNSQRIEIIAVDASGRAISKWSDDQKFSQATGYLVVNPGETITYSETISTREMRAGQTYRLEAGFVNYPELSAATQITPMP